MKRFRALLTAGAILFSSAGAVLPEQSALLPATAYCYADLPEDIDITVEGDYAYSVNADGESVTLQRFTGNEKEITVPEKLGGLPVTVIGEHAYEFCTKLEKAVIPEGVTEICTHAFRELPLRDISFPDSLTVIGDYVFDGCLDLTGVTLPDGLKKLGTAAFSRCRSLTEIMIPGQVTELEPLMFSECVNLTAVTLPEGITSIGKQAFSGCTSLTSLMIPKSVTQIGDEAFRDCSALAEVVFFASLPETGEGVFTGTACQIVMLEEGELVIEDGWLIDGRAARGAVVIPDGVKGIRSNAFQDNAFLTAVTIPDSVTEIGSGAFSGCRGLREITLPAGLTKIADGLFTNCVKLTEITLPESVTEIEACAFWGCTGLTGITLPEGVTELAYDVFFGCTGLTEFTVPDSITSVNAGAFKKCVNLSSIRVSEQNPAYCDIDGVLYNKECTAIVICPPAKQGSIVIPEGVTEIGESVFAQCTGLTGITLPDGITEIGAGAFSGCTGLTELTIPESVETIRYCAFMNCSGLKSITVPDGVDMINDSVFAFCTALTEVIIPESVTAIGNTAFRGCTALAELTVPGSVTKIGMDAFDRCENLTLRCRSGSEALRYALGYGIPYSIIRDETGGSGTVTTDPFPSCNAYGDVDCSGDVKISDAILLARYLAEDKVVITPMGKLNADCYYPAGNELNADDLMTLLSYLAGSRKSLPDFALPDE